MKSTFSDKPIKDKIRQIFIVSLTGTRRYFYYSFETSNNTFVMLKRKSKNGTINFIPCTPKITIELWVYAQIKYYGTGSIDDESKIELLSKFKKMNQQDIDMFTLELSLERIGGNV